eukprot:GHVS01109135.1.p1 GENE.GHVS01109135.1~~GHVS01109135.1.p1  ORF type:complete len:484 (+),score=96.80 GHVS01109135.1:307-1758(+)
MTRDDDHTPPSSSGSHRRHRQPDRQDPSSYLSSSAASLSSFSPLPPPPSLPNTSVVASSPKSFSGARAPTSFPSLSSSCCRSSSSSSIPPPCCSISPRSAESSRRPSIPRGPTRRRISAINRPTVAPSSPSPAGFAGSASSPTATLTRQTLSDDFFQIPSLPRSMRPSSVSCRSPRHNAPSGSPRASSSRSPSLPPSSPPPPELSSPRPPTPLAKKPDMYRPGDVQPTGVYVPCVLAGRHIAFATDVNILLSSFVFCCHHYRLDLLREGSFCLFLLLFKRINMSQVMCTAMLEDSRDVWHMLLGVVDDILVDATAPSDATQMPTQRSAWGPTPQPLFSSDTAAAPVSHTLPSSTGNRQPFPSPPAGGSNFSLLVAVGCVYLLYTLYHTQPVSLSPRRLPKHLLLSQECHSRLCNLLCYLDMTQLCPESFVVLLTLLSPGRITVAVRPGVQQSYVDIHGLPAHPFSDQPVDTDRFEPERDALPP